MQIERSLKHGTFMWDDKENSITISTYGEPDESGERTTKASITLNKVYSFALMRFIIRIAQRNWFRKMVKQ